MIVCDKCGFQGTDPEQCEKCGIIFDRMHTIVDLRPLGALGQALAARGAKAAQPVDPAAVEAAQARVEAPQAPPKPPPRPAPVVPIIERREEKPRLIRGWVAVLALAGLAITAASVVLDRREAMRREEAESDRARAQVLDVAYFELATDAIVDECRRELRRIADPARAEEVRARLAGRVAHLKELLGVAPVSPTARAAFEEALAGLAGFLSDDVPKAIAAAKELGARAEPTPFQALERAAGAVAHVGP